MTKPFFFIYSVNIIKNKQQTTTKKNTQKRKCRLIFVALSLNISPRKEKKNQHLKKD